MSDIRSEFVAEFIGKLDKPVNVGETPNGMRIIYKIIGGTFIGPEINGEVMPLGADWFILRPNGTGELDVRATIRTDTEDIIYIYYRGILKDAKRLMKKYQNREVMDFAEYYFRTTPVFETGSKKYYWLNNIISVGIGELGYNNVKYKIYRIL
jgi:hypothetical protein